VWGGALDKSSPDLIGAQSLESIDNKRTSFWGRGLFMSRTFWGRSLFMSWTFGGGAYSCQNMPKHAQTNHHQMSIASP
jgi:hypothetical protein